MKMQLRPFLSDKRNGLFQLSYVNLVKLRIWVEQG